jgi:hypothetical protein
LIVAKREIGRPASATLPRQAFGDEERDSTLTNAVKGASNSTRTTSPRARRRAGRASATPHSPWCARPPQIVTTLHDAGATFRARRVYRGIRGILASTVV